MPPDPLSPDTPPANPAEPAPAVAGAPKPLFRDLGRRPPSAPTTKRSSQPIIRPPVPVPTSGMVARSLFRWCRALVVYGVARFFDRIKGRNTIEDRARRIVQALGRIGTGGARIAHQLAMRMDLVPLQISLELAAIRDVQPAMPFETAAERLRVALGCPIEEVFEAIDPTPIASETVDCVYQGVLKTGERVAIKVRREGIHAQMLSDMKALGWMSYLLELLTIVRPGGFEQLREEMVAVAADEMDFSLQARAQTIFRQRVERDRLDWLGAPKVYQRLSNHCVMVSELVSGVRLSEVLDAVASKDEEALRLLRGMRIDPRQVARRLLQASWWSLYENLFFLSHPVPENIVVEPGGRLVFLDFEDRGTLTGGRRQQHEQVLSRLAEDDVTGAANAVVGMLSPLPFIDIYDFTKRVESGLWEHLFALRDKDAEWWERTTIGVWTTVLEASRESGVKLRLELLRMMRSCITFETLAARLRPDVRLLSEYERYRIRADHRAARRFLLDIERKDLEDIEASMVARTAQVVEGLKRLGLFIEGAVENLPVSRLALTGKAAYAASQLLRLGVMLLVFVMTAAGLRTVTSWFGDSPLNFWDSLKIIALHPVTDALGFALVAATLRRILFRLDDMGEE